MASKTKEKPVVEQIADAIEETPETPKPTAEDRRMAKAEEHALDADRAAWVADHARPALAPCLCGCGELTKSRFVPGHDALLKRALESTVLVGREGAADAQRALDTFGW